MPASRACTSHHCRQHPARFDRSTWYRSRLHPPPPMTTPEHGANESAALLPFLRRTSRSVLAASPSCCGAKTKGASVDPTGPLRSTRSDREGQPPNLFASGRGPRDETLPFRRPPVSPHGIHSSVFRGLAQTHSHRVGYSMRAPVNPCSGLEMRQYRRLPSMM